MPRPRVLGLLFTAALSVTSSALALAPATVDSQVEPASTAPATTSASVESLKITVMRVQGTVQVRTADDQPWQRVTEGMVVDENAEFRTSLRSAVQIQIPPDQTVTLDRLGVIKVMEAVNDNGKLKTKIGMKYGRTRYDIESAGQEHEASISSPSSTLAIRGTDVVLYDQPPFHSEATSFTGRALFQDAKKQVFFGNKGAGTLKVDANSGNAAQYALAQSVVDPSMSLARSQAEQPLIDAVLSTGASINYDQQKGIKVITGGRPLTDKELIPTLPGVLSFVLRWTQNTNYDLSVRLNVGNNQKSQTVYPIGGFNTVASGGHTEFDHRGGPHGGMEVVTWPKGFPQGAYSIGVNYAGGVPNTPAIVNVYNNGKPVDITNSFENGATVQTVHLTAGPVNPEFHVAPGAVAGIVFFPPTSIGTQSAIGAQSASAIKVMGPRR